MRLEEKIKLFGHYIFCNVRCGNTVVTMQSIDGNSGCVVGLVNAFQLPIEDCVLHLKELNTIDRKHAVICAQIAGIPESLYKNWTVQINIYGIAIFSFPETDNYRNMVVFSEDKLSWKQVDYLRSVGYAIGIDKSLYEKPTKVIQL